MLNKEARNFFFLMWRQKHEGEEYELITSLSDWDLAKGDMWCFGNNKLFFFPSKSVMVCIFSVLNFLLPVNVIYYLT